jgi:hypothetical protein
LGNAGLKSFEAASNSRDGTAPVLYGVCVRTPMRGALLLLSAAALHLRGRTTCGKILNGEGFSKTENRANIAP